MQALKDTFYLMLRDRVAAGNPARVVEIRGVSRPGVVVAENELPGAAGLSAAVTDVFQMQWTGLGVDGRSGLPLAGLTCEISYATDGTSAAGGMDRGRALTAMDEELSGGLRGGASECGEGDGCGGADGGECWGWDECVLGRCRRLGRR